LRCFQVSFPTRKADFIASQPGLHTLTKTLPFDKTQLALFYLSVCVLSSPFLRFLFHRLTFPPSNAKHGFFPSDDSVVSIWQHILHYDTPLFWRGINPPFCPSSRVSNRSTKSPPPSGFCGMSGLFHRTLLVLGLVFPPPCPGSVRIRFFSPFFVSPDAGDHKPANNDPITTPPPSRQPPVVNFDRVS